MPWKTVPDSSLRHEWQCPECHEKEVVSPDWYQDNGTPMCAECDEDMVYMLTKVKV